MLNIFVAGHKGMVGSQLCGMLTQFALTQKTELNLITAERSDLDLLDQQQVNEFFEVNAIDEVYLAAARVGGIVANNTARADFVFENLAIQNNVINAAFRFGVSKLLFLGSSCIYPKHAKQPIRESELLSGPLEQTNEPYAIAKIAGLKLCEAYRTQYSCDFRAVMPTNLYGPGDNFHPEHSHVIPGLMVRFHHALIENADEIVIWGSGEPKREFLHVRDLATACIHVMGMSSERYESVLGETVSHINVGTGVDCTIRELAELLKLVSGFKGELVFDSSKPDGTHRKLLDVSKLEGSGWRYKTSLESGLKETWEWFLAQPGLNRA